MDPVFALAPHPEYAHEVAARLARMAREDREAVAGSLRRLRFRNQDDAAASPSRTARGLHLLGRESKARRSCDFRYASPITSIPRQRSDRRIPHISHADVTRTVVPHSADGQTHPRYPARTTVAAEHHDYLTEGAHATYRTHFDYITRLVGPMSAALGMPAIDILDFEADHRDRNALAVLSNISVHPERQRSLFEAAERCERVAYRGTLKVSTEHAEVWTKIAAAPGVPAWVERAASLLQLARESSVAKARQRKQKHDHHLVTIGDVNLAEAYDRLVWADDHLGTDAAALPQFEQGRSGRVQTRFVFELPHGLDARQHRVIAERLCARLGEEGWMYVAAIHSPDRKNDPRNTHLHIDAYDRPSRWMQGMGTDGKPGAGCWDFEVAVKKGNGRLSYPYRRQKIGVRRPDSGQKLHDTGKAYFDALRAAYIAIANDVAAETPGSTRYAVGTYRDHGIDQEQLEHLGDKVIGNEKQGLVTAAGSRNARRIFDDRLRHVRNVALAELLLLRREAQDLLRAAATEEARLAIWQWRQMKRLAVTKQAQSAAVGTVRDMSISRAVAVIDYGKNPERIAEAKAWIEDGDRLAQRTPSKPGRLGQGDAATEAIMVAAELLEDKVRGALPGANPRLTYRPHAKTRPKLLDPRYRTKSRNRLIAWIDEHGDDEQALTFKDGEVALGLRYLQSIDRLFELLIDDLLIQKRLRDIRDRRKPADDGRLVRQHGTATVPEEAAAVSESGRSIVDAVAIAADVQVLPTRDHLSSVPHDPALSTKEESPRPTPAPIRKTGGLRAAAVQLMTSKREDGWQQIISGRASIAKTANGYSIVGIPDDLRRALLHKDFASELDRRFLTLNRGRATKPPMSAMPQFMPLTTLNLPNGVDAFADVPNGPPDALRNAQGLGTAPGLGGGPALSPAPSPLGAPDLPIRATKVGNLDPGLIDLPADGAALVANDPTSRLRRSKLFEQAEAHAQQTGIAGAGLKGPNRVQTPAPFRRPDRGR